MRLRLGCGFGWIWGRRRVQRHLRDADRLYRLLVKRGWRDGVDLMYVKAKGAVHDEEAWARRFGDVLRFLFPAITGQMIAAGDCGLVVAKNGDFRHT